ncbi:MAG: helix-turn-helix transcriptional regulator [Verrucomicrobia bacterium]|nr:helix-turn-helix transcriptional regulator [Verrucomicrobiota bacterium]
MRRKSQTAKNIVSERIREARKRHSPPLTQDQLAGRVARARVQLDRTAIAKIENGQRGVFDFELKALATALDVDANWLLADDVQAAIYRRKTSGTGGEAK